jgi:GAF domain-containing protein
MLVGKEELLTWASASDARRAGPGRPGGAGAGPCMVAWRERRPVAVRDVRAEPRWAEVAPALVAAQLRAALSVPVELARGPDRDLGGVRGWPAGLERP